MWLVRKQAKAQCKKCQLEKGNGSKQIILKIIEMEAPEKIL